MHPHESHGRPRRVKAVTKKRGLGAGGNSIHLILTICTCGAWLIVWIPWWIFRMIVRRKQTTTYYEQ